MKVQKFLEWVDYGSQDSFTEMFSDVLYDYEKKMQEEGVQIDPDNFFDDLQDLHVEGKWEKEIGDAASNWYESHYHHGYDAEWGEPKVTPEYTRIDKEVSAEIAKSSKTKDSKKTSYNKREKLLSEALLKNVIDKHWKEWKAIYQKWIDYLHAHRGELAARKYNL